MKKTKKVKKSKVKKISFLRERKNVNDKLFDLKKHLTKSISVSKDKYKIIGIEKLARELEITPTTLRKYFKQGFINPNNDNLIINIERNFDKLKIRRTKEVSAFFGKKDNFFKLKPFGKVKENEQLFFKAGLYMVFRSGKKGIYTIQNLPLSHYSNLYPEGYREFFDIIKEKLNDHPSLKFFRFNYFSAQKIQLDIIPIEQRRENFKNKHSKNNGKNKKNK